MSGEFAGEAAWSDSDDDEEYQSRCINAIGNQPKRHKPTQQSKHEHDAGVPEPPGDPKCRPGQCIQHMYCASHTSGNMLIYGPAL